MVEVSFNPAGPYCITDEARMDMLDNLYRYRRNHQKNIDALEGHNKTVPK